jgi:DNA recombination protein RmuC
MNEWLIRQGVDSPQTALVIGLLVGLLLAVAAAWAASRRSARQQREALRPEIDALTARLEESRAALGAAEQERAVLETRLADREQHYREQIDKLEEAEKRLADNFERLAAKIFEERSQKLSDLNSKQIDSILKPLGEKLNEFRSTVENAHREETAQHRVMKAKIVDLEKLNERLHEDATNLSRALTVNVKAQGNWGEQQLERLLEISGLEKGREYSTQYSVTTEGGQRVQPDLVLHLPEGKSIVLDSKVSLVAWTRLQAAEDDEARAAALAEHVQSLRQHVKGLGERRYAEIPRPDRGLAGRSRTGRVRLEPQGSAPFPDQLPGHDAHRGHKVALLSPTNFLATMRTVGSVWAVHKQNRNAQEIAGRAGLLYDKFAGFVDNLKQVGDRLQQARQSYDAALGQLSTGAGNLLRQAELLRELGARHTKRIEPAMLARGAGEGDGSESGDTAAADEPGAADESS